MRIRGGRVRCTDKQGAARPFGAQAPEIGGATGIAAHPNDALSFAPDHHAAADAVVTRD